MTAPPFRPAARAAALRYDQGSDALPHVVASGRGAVAERIVALAFANGIPVREDSDLAAILAAVDEGAQIPPEAVIAVAEVLSHLYRLNRWLAAERASSPVQSPGPDQA
ncbi:EscU/YscU/HrcU family type III secretion system export apparatus switch protein [Indioceanicola profundi]|uniref:EscU/YscU/HrcU family type III secretion system export apparatus switch protein n=1 Tax=Indioceanicola profundi TaxID=2220096 RepID=UPI000E6AD1C9|nr:EscU/YscU/HrcU family type III secretion system export apparatus switch protein [Indioceanicola profundi]